MPAAAWMRARKLLGLPRLLPGRSRSAAQDVGRAHQGLIFFGFSSSSSSLYSAGAGAAGEPSQKKKRSTARKVVTIGAISLAGGVALSAINDLAIFHGCTRKAIEKATENAEVVRAIGVPIARGPWYDASVVLGHRRRSVSCTFPVTGPRGSAVFQIEAIRNGEDGVLSFLRHHDWEILAMDARLELQAAAAEAEAASDDDAHHHQPLVMNLNLMSSTADEDGCKS